MKFNRRDDNEGDIVSALQDVGATIDYVERRPYDLVVGFRSKNYLLEVKTKKGKLKESQEKFRNRWNGFYAIVRSREDALIAIGAIGPQER